MAYVVGLNNIDDKALAGEKAALLGTVFSLAPVPKGFVIKTTSFQRFVSLSRDKIKEVVIDSMLDEEQKADRIIEIIQSIRFPEDLQKEIVDAYEALGADFSGVQNAYDVVKAKTQIPVVVRSSLFVEKDESFVESSCETNVIGAEALLKAIQSCWADFFNDEVLEFMMSENIDFDDVKVSVLVQRMVYAHKSGVVYTVNPDSGEDDEIAVESCWGLDNYFLLDEQSPDFFVVDKESLQIKEHNIKPQQYAYLVDKKTGEQMKKIIPESEWEIKSLKDEEVIKLASIAKKIEEKLEEALEIEFIIEGDKVYITQVSYYADDEDEADEYEEGAVHAEGDELEEGTEYEDAKPKDEEQPDEEAEYHYEEEADAEEFEAELKQLISRYVAINPALKPAFETLEKEVIELFKKNTE